ncbi:RNA polymerase sigma-54 factor [Paraliobacillus quinghaiensis]|uniref:RNA polymerase sigma-54 factor n=1 Tax=Paraliobacillus quinghaiensis TaxID=470815 RepID=A0A917TXI7_9BACI|nr:RNA polymerase factor sigma-54 [Paraliobacillus quinghaiensis]GGM42168.1 RNA polymerase sigma-54 factor [Paraliobacillus quinghaiensis]
MINLGLFQQQKTQLHMTPQMKQAISILQYSSTDLLEFIKKEALENPLIELDVTSFQFDRRKSHASEKSDVSPLDFIASQNNTLFDYLHEQVVVLDLSKQEQSIMEYIFLTLDESGYFRESIQDAATYLNVSSETFENALHLVQKQVEPVGIAATDLQQCLSLQMEHYYPEYEHAQAVLAYLDDLSKSNWNVIAKKLGISIDEVKEILQIIKSLNPKPGLLVDDQVTDYIVPDFYIYMEDGKSNVELNNQLIPKFNLSSEYQSMIQAEHDTETANYLQELNQRALWLRKSIDHRTTTLLKVMKAIANEQVEFFQKGPSFLKPLNLKEVAELCNVHVSTVSRATSHKYVHTQFGIFELKYFFSSGFTMNSGKTVSSQPIKQMIKDLIENENPRKPLSDQQLSLSLKEKDVDISRRTVTKYREQLNILSSTKRKLK